MPLLKLGLLTHRNVQLAHVEIDIKYSFVLN